MTIENSDDTAHVGVTDPAAPVALERSSSSAGSVHGSASRADVASGAIETAAASATATHDSTPPLSRRLAPPPKPKRDSGAASAPPTPPPTAPASGRPAAEGPDLAASANALKAPIAPSISFSADGKPTLDSPALTPSEPSLVAANSVAPLSQPPPLRRRSNPSLSDAGNVNASTGGRTPSDPALASGSVGAAHGSSNAPHPIAAPSSRVESEPGARVPSDSSPSAPESAEPRAPDSSAPASAPPSSSAIFAMRIIAVGDSVRTPAAQEPTPDIDPNSYPPSASRLGTTVRRSSRPVAASVSAPTAPVTVPKAGGVPTDLGPALELDLPIDVELPVPAAPAPTLDLAAVLDAAAAVLEALLSRSPRRHAHSGRSAPSAGAASAGRTLGRRVLARVDREEDRSRGSVGGRPSSPGQ